jgi:hypothetical protein
MDYGSHGIIIARGSSVEKKTRRATGHPIQLQMTIHRIVQNTINQGNYDYIRVPILSDVNPMRYKMERISTRRPLILGEPDSCRISNIREVKAELVRLWVQLWELGYAAWDFDLFVHDGKVVLLDFDRFGVRMPNGVPDLPVQIPVGSFFNHACFPTDFKEALQVQIQEVLHF